MSTHVSEFLDTHAVDGALAPELAAQLLESMSGEGDTTQVETGGEPVAPAAQATAPAGEQANKDDAGQPAAQDESQAVILAKDGKHTIPFERLTEAREAAQTWKAQAEAAQAQLAALQSQAQERSEAGKTATATDKQVAAATAAIDAGAVDPEIFGDFSEAALAKGIKTLVEMGVQQAKAELQGELTKVVEPLQAKQAVSARDAHYQAIYDKHPDADSVAESAELQAWIARQPSFTRDGFQAVLAKGSAAQVIELFDSFKQAAGTPAAAASKDAVKAQAKAAVAKVSAPVPLSLSDIPGVAGPANKTEAMEQMDAVSLLETMQGMSLEQRETFLNRSL